MNKALEIFETLRFLAEAVLDCDLFLLESIDLLVLGGVVGHRRLVESIGPSEAVHRFAFMRLTGYRVTSGIA